MRAVPLHSANHLYLRTPPVGNHSYLAMLDEFSNIPPKLRSLNAAHTHFFLYKNTFFPKKICVCAFFVVPLQPLS